MARQLSNFQRTCLFATLECTALQPLIAAWATFASGSAEQCGTALRTHAGLLNAADFTSAFQVHISVALELLITGSSF